MASWMDVTSPERDFHRTTNGIPDECELGPDCNGNAIHHLARRLHRLQFEQRPTSVNRIVTKMASPHVNKIATKMGVRTIVVIKTASANLQTTAT